MAYTSNSPSTFFSNQQFANPVSSTTTLFKNLSVDDQLGLLWFIYTEIGRSITPAATGAARLQFAEGLLNQVKNMPQSEQMQFMRDLVNKVNNPLTRAYGVLSTNTKLAFWYQLAELMKEGIVIPVPQGYTMSRDAKKIFNNIVFMDFSQQITILRNAVADMGVDPLA